MISLYELVVNNIGKYISIIDGEPVLLDTGSFIISDTLKANSVYVDKFTKTATLVPGKYQYTGYCWNVLNSNCATLCARWLDDTNGTKLLSAILSLSIEHRLKVYKHGYEDILYQYGFSDSSIPSPGCIVRYQYDNHIGILLDNGRILHHLANKYSSIDILDANKIKSILCYSKI
jgi:hypothetical protein